MCCPSVSGWNFNCAPATNVGAAPYGCLATFTTGAKITGSRTDLIVGTGQAETHTVGGDTGVNAWGIALLSTTPLTSSATITSAAATTSDAVVSVPSSAISTAPSTGSAPTSTSSSASGLSTGASIGIGVGVGVGALSIIGLLAFCIIGRRRNVRQQQRQQQKPMVQDSYDHNGVIHNGQYYYGGLEAASHGTKMQQPNERALQSEAPTHVDPYEMQG
ncbi:hypothetical protein TruAng_000075 [Truncatella angustata]|nr:hypothetical protein TruAng_000075 [Truncatella angustata]